MHITQIQRDIFQTDFFKGITGIARLGNTYTGVENICAEYAETHFSVTASFLLVGKKST